MSKVAKRVFGSDLKPEIKLKLQNAQAFGSGIFDEQTEDTSFDYDDFREETTFGGDAFLSSRTPFARMWTAISVVRKQGDEVETPAEEIEPLDFDANRYYYKKDKKIKVQPISRLPEDGPKVYILGTNSSGDSERGILDEQAPPENLDILTPSQRENYEDKRFEGGQSVLKPPSGITSINTSTQGSYGPVAGVLKTTVNFTIYDFEEYDLIYSKYFLRPGAQIFVDFGWTSNKNFKLYDPNELIKSENRTTYDTLLWGETDNNGVEQKPGQIQDANYDIEIIKGKVVNFTSDFVPESGAYRCALTLSSKNQLLFDRDMNNEEVRGKAKQNLLSNLDYRIIKLAADALFPAASDGSGGILPDTSYTADDKKTWNSIANQFAAEVLGSDDFNTPTDLNIQLGIYWKGTFQGEEKIPSTDPDAIYLSWGFIEDVIFNQEFGKYYTVDEKDIWGVTDKIEFDSTNSYTFFDENLYKRQKFLKSGNKLPFLFPENWDNSYSKLKQKSPEGSTTETDKATGIIPIREVFLQLKLVKQAIKEADNLNDVFRYIFKRISKSTGAAWNWSLDVTNLNFTSLGVLDKNYINKKLIVEKAETDEVEEFYDDLFTFEPHSPRSIIKTMNLNMSLGGGDAIASKLALTGLGSGGKNIFPASDIIDEVVSAMQLEDSEGEDLVEIEYVPREGNSDIEKFFKKRNSPKSDLADPTYLSAQNVYGEDGITAEFPTNEEVESIISKASEISKKEAEKRTPPSATPTEEFTEQKAEYENSGFRFVENTYDYFTEKYVTTNIGHRPTILPIKLNLTLLGFGGFAPGDLFRVGMIPSRYSDFVFFQVMQISHSLTPGNFTTTLDCVMRFRDDKKENVATDKDVLATTKVLSPFVLKNEFRCKGIDRITPFIGYVEPIMENTIDNVDYIFKISTFQGGTSDDIYDNIDKSFAYKADADKAKADEVFNTIKNNTDSICKVKQKMSENGEAVSIYKYYKLDAPADGEVNLFYIYIRKGVWFMSSSLTTSGHMAVFDVFEQEVEVEE